LKFAIRIKIKQNKTKQTGQHPADMLRGTRSKTHWTVLSGEVDGVVVEGRCRRYAAQAATASHS
jgi:hypothetical protein